MLWKVLAYRWRLTSIAYLLLFGILASLNMNSATKKSLARLSSVFSLAIESAAQCAVFVRCHALSLQNHPQLGSRQDSYDHRLWRLVREVSSVTTMCRLLNQRYAAVPM